jgi:DNA-binding transcriptional LysR family regulator
MSFTVRQLKAFATVAGTGGFRTAAEALSLSPAAVSLLVRELESAVGFAVFERTTRRVVLSRAGKEFLPAAERLLTEMKSAQLTALEVKASSAGAVRVAAPLVIASLILPFVIAEFQRRNPGLAVRPVDASVADLIRLVEADQADFAIGADRPTGVAVLRQRLYDTPWVVWCAPEHPLAQVRAVCWHDLKNHSVIGAGDDFEVRIAVALEKVPGLRHFAPAYVVANVTTALGLASAGLGVTLAPSYVEVIAGVLGLVRRDLEQPRINREMSLFRATTRPLTDAAAQFERFLLSFVRERHFTQFARQAAPRFGSGH